MLQVAADLHLHSCLSPCADITMLPGEIAVRLSARGVRIASLTDHNSACNAYAFCRVFEKAGILFVPGIEVTTSEEVHVLCYFEDLPSLWSFSRKLLSSYPRVVNDPDHFGYELVCNERDEFVGQFPFLLSMANLLSLDDLRGLVDAFEGVAVPSHMDRRYGLLYQLGIVTEDMAFPTYEVAHKVNMAKVAAQLPGMPQFVSNSDAHNLDSISPPRYMLEIQERNVHEVLLALRHKDGRGVLFP
ncbi:MAG: PHP domain-containing protein [Candidatus Cryosericum sp.]